METRVTTENSFSFVWKGEFTWPQRKMMKIKQNTRSKWLINTTFERRIWSIKVRLNDFQRDWKLIFSFSSQWTRCFGDDAQPIRRSSFLFATKQRWNLSGDGIHDRWWFDVVSVYKTSLRTTRGSILYGWNSSCFGLFTSKRRHSPVKRIFPSEPENKIFDFCSAILNRTMFLFRRRVTLNWPILDFQKFEIEEVRWKSNCKDVSMSIRFVCFYFSRSFCRRCHRNSIGL